MLIDYEMRIVRSALLLSFLLANSAWAVSWAELLANKCPENNTQAISSFLQKAETLAAAEYARLQKSREVYSWEVAGPRDRVPHYCTMECACLAKNFSRVLRANGMNPITLRLLQPRNSLGLRMQPAARFYNQFSQYHDVILLHDGGFWFVLDELVIGATKPETFCSWKKRIQDIDRVIAHLPPIL